VIAPANKIRHAMKAGPSTILNKIEVE